MTTTDPTFELFLRASLNDEDCGYPDDVAFVSENVENVDAIVHRHLREHRALVIVSEEGYEVLVEPRPRNGLAGLYDTMRGQTKVTVGWRTHEHGSPYAVRTSVGRHPVADLRRPAHV